MTKRYRSIKVSTLINAGIAIFFVAAAALTIAIVNHKMRQQALVEAEAKMRLMLDHNMAVHTYFSQILKPNLFAWSEPFRDADYFDPSWMSSTYAIREMGKYFASFSLDDYYYKDAAINARSPENEADADEHAFILELQTNPALEGYSTVREIDGQPYLVVIRPGEVLEASCLHCHSTPADAPQDMVRWYGPERSFHREAELGNVISAVSVRVPLAVAYAEADRLSMQLSLLLLALLGALFAAQYWMSRRLVFQPLGRVRDLALHISGDSAHLGAEIPLPFGRELRELTAAFNAMSVDLRQHHDHLEERVRKRTDDLTTVNALLEREMAGHQQADAALKAYSERLEDMVEARTRELQTAQERLLRQERLVLLGQLTGGIAHELRGPLGVVKNSAYLLNMLLEEHSVSDPEITQTLDFIQKGVMDSDRTINSLLNFARTRAPARQEIHIKEVLYQTLFLANPPANVELVHHVDENVPPMLADPDQLQQALRNLVANAIQAMPEGGRLSVHARCDSDAHPEWIIVSVADTGEGMSPERMSRLFEPLFSTKAQGTGLGLTLARLLVEAHGGHIEVASAPGQGTTFEVWLPINQDPNGLAALGVSGENL